VAGAAIGAALLDGEAATFMADLLPADATVPSRRALLGDNLRWRGRMLQTLLGAAWHPARTFRRWRQMVHEARTLLRRSQDRQPTGLNLPLGPRRSSAVLEYPLAAVKQAGHAAGATVNDVLLAAVGGGLRALLDVRGEAVDTATLYASVPVSIRTENAAALGNRTTGLLVDVRVDEPHDRSRLTAIARDTRWQKDHHAWVGLMGVMDSPWVPAWFHRRATRLFRNQRMINVMVSNVPGPVTPLHIAGAPIRAVFPVLPIAVNVPIGVAAISYAGRLVLGVRSDPDLVPDVQVFVDGVEESLHRLGVTPAIAA
jgi:diacylglycerol O-acyltransferase / wax synthase